MSRVVRARGRAGRLVRRAAARLAVGAVLVACTMLLAPQEASACAVGYGYRPSVDFSDISHHRTCSTGTSTAGVAAFAVLVLGALAAAGVVAFRSGERRMGADTPGRSGPTSALAAYLDATGVVPLAWGEGHAP
ncbi:hypothetical protein ACWEWG_17175 [Streptomyces sp. NPDC003758]|uniref:Uncharacterized protein n=1 Tax=Streptomyces cynarae TaxID=2981134 RepID=A0ABY6E268_9ACTN|nr:hypothetical protein [Streptomyces cynarae]UXY20018.1 hypothetical protein N8I84_15805 [Streptomyces cynarae]